MTFTIWNITMFKNGPFPSNRQFKKGTFLKKVGFNFFIKLFLHRFLSRETTARSRYFTQSGQLFCWHCDVTFFGDAQTTAYNIVWEYLLRMVVSLGNLPVAIPLVFDQVRGCQVIVMETTSLACSPIAWCLTMMIHSKGKARPEVLSQLQQTLIEIALDFMLDVPFPVKINHNSLDRQWQ